MKKYVILLAISIFSLSSVKAQLTYSDYWLTFKTTQYRDYVTTWGGWAHAFKSSAGVFKIQLQFADVRIGSTSNKLVIFDTEGIGFLDLYCRELFKSSDIRGKVNIKPISTHLNEINSTFTMGTVGTKGINSRLSKYPATNTVLNLKPVSYQFADQAEYEKYNIRPTNITNIQEYGFIAQDIDKILPSLVAVGADDKLCVNYIGLIPILTAAIQELSERVTELETELAKVK